MNDVLKEIDDISQKINSNLDKKNDRLKMFLSKRKIKEQMELEAIKEKVTGAIIKKVYGIDSKKLDNNLLDLVKSNIPVGEGLKKLKNINKRLDSNIKIYDENLTSFIDEFKNRCIKNNILREDVDILSALIEEIYE